MWAGRVDHLPRVPHVRAGRYPGAALLGGIDGTCKQVSTTWETAFPRCPLTVLRFCARRGPFSGGKKIYLGSGYLITYIRPLSTPQGRCGGMDCSGCVWMTQSQLGRYSHFGMYELLWARACCWARFSVANIYILVAKMYLYLFQCFPDIWGSRNRWMG